MTSTDTQASIHHESNSRCCKLSPSRILHYRLLTLRHGQQTRYYIQVELNGERCTVLLPCNDRTDADQIFERIRRGKVTPCTLHDVLEDMK